MTIFFVAARDYWIAKTLNAIQCKIDYLTQLIQKVVNDWITAFTLPEDVMLPIDHVDALKHLED